MTWHFRFAAPGNPHDELLVGRLASALTLSASPQHPLAGIGSDLARGKWDPHSFVGLWSRTLDLAPAARTLTEDPCAMALFIADEKTGVVRGTAVSFAQDISHDSRVLLVDDLFQMACLVALGIKCTTVEFDSGLACADLERVLLQLGCRHGDDPHVWTSSVQPGALLATVAPAGAGPWRVVLYDDDVTTLNAVAVVLEKAAGLEWYSAQMMTYRVHNNGSMTIRRHLFRWAAERTRRRMVDMFKQAGFSTRVEVTNTPGPPAAG